MTSNSLSHNMAASALQMKRNSARMNPTYLLSSLQWTESHYAPATEFIIFPDIKSSISSVISKCQCVHLRLCSTPFEQKARRIYCRAAWRFLCIYELPLEKPAVKFRLTSIDFFVTSFFTTGSLTWTSFLFSTFQMNLFFYVRFFPSQCPLRYNSSENHSRQQAHPQTTNFNAIFSHFCIQPPYGKG
jgi:hypothetical protein